MDYTVEVLTREEQPSRVDEVHDYENFGELVADKLAAGIGSWTFILVQTAGIILWVIANVCAFKFHWDPYPFILMNLMFSVQAAYTGPILLLAANRAAKKDRIRDDRDDQEIGEILAIVRELKSKSNL